VAFVFLGQMNLQYRNIIPPLRLLFLMWLVFYAEQYFKVDFAFLGVLPRNLYGLIGIATAPLIHGNLTHLLSNSLPMVTLGIALFFFYPKIAQLVFFLCYFLPGILVWIFARPFYHIGASGFVYALAFFLIFLGFFRQDNKSVLISIVVMLIYGSLIFNLNMLSPHLSWESHVFGAVVGVGIALSVKRNLSVRKG
jgi:membrane associated rhomboid family serine protease